MTADIGREKTGKENSREMTENSLPQIGNFFGGRDHTTVMHGCDKISGAMRDDFAFRKRVEELIALVKEQ
jgi:chromosomal replication initiator protein